MTFITTAGGVAGGSRLGDFSSEGVHGQSMCDEFGVATTEEITMTELLRLLDDCLRSADVSDLHRQTETTRKVKE